MRRCDGGTVCDDSIEVEIIGGGGGGGIQFVSECIWRNTKV
jgi:hypothetical protein